MYTLPSLKPRQLVRVASEARARRSRLPPKLRAAGGSSGRPSIYYLSPDPVEPRGGVRVFYRHVDLLNDLGYVAKVLHTRRGYRASWFENDTALVAAQDATLYDDDILIVPEFYGGNLERLPRGPRIALFNQGAYFTFTGVSVARAASLVAAPVEAIMTISEDSLKLLSYTFPGTPLHYARPVLDGTNFHTPETPLSNRRRIAYTTSRRPAERHQLLSILHARGNLSSWEFVPISNMSEQQVANTLRDCSIFLSFSERDGFGLPPTEAMACGCYVIGYHGQGGREFFSSDYCQPIADGDILSFARAVEAATASYEADPQSLTQFGLQASREILSRYNTEGLRADLLDFFQSLNFEAR